MRPTPTCDRCGSPIEWATTMHGQRQALDPGPSAAGNVAAYRDGTGTLRARALGAGDSPQHVERRRMPHAATCTPRVDQLALPTPTPAAPARTRTPSNVIPINQRRRKART
jgi:hypothetical protein